MRPPATAAATNIMPTNNRPLPRKTVAKKRSSCAPIRSLITPINHRKAIPANGMRFSPTATAVLFPESVSHPPATAELAGAESLSRVSDAIRSTEKTMPASAAARGVFSALLAVSEPGAGAVGHGHPLPWTGATPGCRRFRWPGALPIAPLVLMPDKHARGRSASPLRGENRPFAAPWAVNLPISAQTSDCPGAWAELGDTHFAFESCVAGYDMDTLVKVFPDNACPAEHWEFIFKGKVRGGVHPRPEKMLGVAFYIPGEQCPLNAIPVRRAASLRMLPVSDGLVCLGRRSRLAASAMIANNFLLTKEIRAGRTKSLRRKKSFRNHGSEGWRASRWAGSGHHRGRGRALPAVDIALAETAVSSAAERLRAGRARGPRRPPRRGATSRRKPTRCRSRERPGRKGSIRH